MRLETKVTVLKKLKPKYYGFDDYETKILRTTVQSIEITLSETCKLVVTIQSSLNFHKFRRSSERIVRELNKYVRSINFLHSSDYLDRSFYAAYDITKETHVLWIDSSDLYCVKFSLEQRKIVKKVLDGNLKRDFSHNPPKPKSDMEYRKRAYYGKCKR